MSDCAASRPLSATGGDMDDEATDLILQAVIYGDDALLAELLCANAAAANVCGVGRLTALQHAVLRGRVECIRVLLRAGANPDDVGGVAKTPLHMAAAADAANDPAIVRALVEGGADLFLCDTDGYTALQLAQIHGRGNVADVLLTAIESHYANTSELRARLCAACVDGDRAAVADLLRQVPANSRARILNGEQRGATDEKSALYIACEHGRADCVTELLSVDGHSIIHTATGDSVLHAAIASQDTLTVERILKKFPYLMNSSNSEGSQPLHWACRCGNLVVIRTLLETEFPRDKTKLHETSGPADAGLWCYRFVCDLNAADAECRTPLYLAAADGYAAITQYLVDYKVRVQSVHDALSVSSSGTGAAYEETVQLGLAGMLDTLVVDDVKTWRRPIQLDVYSRSGRIALMAACAGGYVDVVRILLNAGSDVNLPIALTDVEISALQPMEEARCSGSGALVEAAQIGSTDLVRLLFAAGAFDYDNQALAVAISTNRRDLVPLFLCQLTFRDNEYRINKNALNGSSGSSMLPSMVGGLLASTSGSLFTAANGGFPTVACQLNWNNATLGELRLEWLNAAAIYFNSRTRPRELSLAALTRVDLSNNRLNAVPSILFQLPSLRVLNVEQNLISSIDFATVDSTGKQLSERCYCPVLEELVLASNELVDLPLQFFAEQHFPALRSLNVNGNRLTALPAALWLAPRLRELNAAGNRIAELRTRVGRRDAASQRAAAAAERSQRQYYQRRHQSSQNFQRRLQLYQQQQKQLFLQQLPSNGIVPASSASENREPIIAASGGRAVTESVLSDTQSSLPSSHQRLEDEMRQSQRERSSRTSPRAQTSARRSSTEDSGDGDGAERRTRSRSATKKTIVREADVIRVNIWQKRIELSNIENDDEGDRTTLADLASCLDSPDPNSSNNRENFISALRVLNLSGNQLKHVPSCLACCCPRLTRLDLSTNLIDSLGPIECLPATLCHLNLANNRLTKCLQPAVSKDNDAWRLMCNAPAAASAVVENDATALSFASQSAGGHNFALSRHSRSRSKSVARNQRSLSVIRGDATAAMDSGRGCLSDGFEPCLHKSHCRLEALKTLNLSNNALTSLELLAPLAGGARMITAEQFNWKEHGQQMRVYLLFPALTTLNVSENRLRHLPSTVSLLAYLAVLNISANRQLESLPAELSLLEKLWNVDAKGCPALGEPLRGVIDQPNYKTSELLAVLRNKLENSKPYPKMKLMILGGQNVGKTSLLRQLRSEGQVAKKALHSESWSLRLGHPPAKGIAVPSADASTLAGCPAGSPMVDVAEWSYEPRKKSTTRSSTASTDFVGPITFRTWDFIGMTKELSAIQQYFFTRRCLYVIVWKVTEGEIGLTEIHNQLLTIQARSPNATVLIVGTHIDVLKENRHRFLNEYLTDLDVIIQERFVGVSDADKKGLPRVVASLYVSTRSKDDARALASLLYQAAVDVRVAANRRQRTLVERWPAAFLALEKIVVRVVDELRVRAAEPILTFDDFWILAATQMIEEFGRPFRDILEFRQACQFLHENGVIVYFDDTSLRDFVFLDPPWLCSFLRTALLAAGRNRQTEGLTEATDLMPLIDEQRMYATLKFALHQFAATAHQTVGGGEAATKFRFFQICFLSLLSKFELALPCLNGSLLLAPLLPNEYLLRAHYPGAKVRIKAKIHKWQLRRRISPIVYKRQRRRANDVDKSTAPLAPLSPIRNYLAQRQIVRRSLAAQREGACGSIDRVDGEVTSAHLDSNAGDASIPCSSNCTQKGVTALQRAPRISMRRSPEKNLRRLYVLQYLPPGFWARLTTRLLDDEGIGATIARLFILTTSDPPADAMESSKIETELIRSIEETFNRMSASDGLETEDQEPKEAETSFIVLPPSDRSSAKNRVSPSVQRADGFDWLLWKSGLEVRVFGMWLFSLAEFLPLADVRDANYSLRELVRHADDGTWKLLRLDANQFIIEILIGHVEFKVLVENHVHQLEIDPTMAARLMETVVNILDDLLEDWFPVLGTRFIHTSEGRLLVDRLIPCNLCAAEAIAPFNRTNDAKSRKDGETSTTVAEVTESPESGRIHLFSIEECILQGRRQARMAHNQASDPLSLSIDSATRQTTTNHTDDAFMCPRHSDGPLSLAAMAPDTLFTDLDNSFVVSPANVRRGQLVGRGAFGFVFNGLIRRQRGDAYAEVALKIFEPVDPSSGSMVISSVSDDISAQSIPVARRAGDSQRVSARAAFEAYRLKWQNDTLTATHAYCTVRQELRMLTGLRYAHVTALVGFCAAPMMLIVELAPHGALNAVLTRYRRAGARLASNTLQQTCLQIARALEYLHANRIIYRDLKSENVLVWRFPTPHVAGRPSDSVLLPSASILPVSSIPMIQNAGARGNVHLKLGDYGISRVSHPGGICKGYGGTEGFMAPEIMRYSGEQPYTDLVDSYSFGMFLYELISLRQPYEGLDQMKEFILEGRRPYVSEKELLHPTSVLDLIVVCWSESPIERPTASQLVGICGAPEFSRLMDVAVLDERHVKDREMSQIRNLKDVKIRSNSAFSSSKNHHTALATVVVTDLSLSQVWFITCGQMPNDGRICVLAASQYGWTEHRILESSGLLPPAEVDAFAQADTNEVWLAGVDGTIRVYSTRTFEVLGKFLPTQFIEKISKRKSTDHNNMASSAIAKDLNALRTNVKALSSQNIISLSTSSRKGSTVKRSNEDSKTMQSDPQSLDIKNRSEDDRRIPLSSRHRVKDIQPYSARGLVVLALSNHVLVLRLLPALSDDFSVSVSNGETFTPPILIEAIEMADDCEIISLAVLESTDEWQIWTSHDAGRLIVHHINGFTDRLVYSTSVRHFDAEDSAAVNFVVPSFSGAPLVWTCLEDDPRIFQWRASAPLAISRTLNCAKILPESESLSSMDSAVIRNVHITAMQLVTPMAGASGEKLIVGTNHGVVIIVDAEQMLPLSSFRPHLSAVEQILVCSDAKTSAMFSDDTQLAATVSEASPYAERRRSSATGTARRELVQMRDALGGNVKKFIVPAPTPGSKWRLPAALRSRFSPRSAIVQSKSSYTLPAVAGELAETVARGVKDILTSPATNETSNLPPAGRDPFAEEITFVTIGSDYRCLLGRFLSSESEALGTSDTYRKTFALFWRSDGWTCK